MIACDTSAVERFYVLTRKSRCGRLCRMRHASRWLAVRASRGGQVLAGFGLVMAAACSSSSKGHVGDGGGDISAQDSAQDGATNNAGGCLDNGLRCFSGTAGGECGDWYEAAQCVGSTWKCPTGMVAESLCGCFNSAPTCHPGTVGGACGSETATPTCSGGLWNCPEGTVWSLDCTSVLPNDGGAAGDGGGDAGGCLGRAPDCASGTEGGECTDWSGVAASCVGSTWKCPTGMVVMSLCGCFDWRPTCSPGTAGGACTSETVSPICGGGVWSCPDGTVSTNDCACVLSGDGGAVGDGGCP
jgi:hypothetical protein